MFAAGLSSAEKGLKNVSLIVENVPDPVFRL